MTPQKFQKMTINEMNNLPNDISENIYIEWLTYDYMITNSLFGNENLEVAEEQINNLPFHLKKIHIKYCLLHPSKIRVPYGCELITEIYDKNPNIKVYKSV